MSLNGFFLLNLKIIAFCHFTNIDAYAYCKPVLLPQPDSLQNSCPFIARGGDQTLKALAGWRLSDEREARVSLQATATIRTAGLFFILHCSTVALPQLNPVPPSPSRGAELLCSILPADGD